MEDEEWRSGRCGYEGCVACPWEPDLDAKPNTVDSVNLANEMPKVHETRVGNPKNITQGSNPMREVFGGQLQILSREELTRDEEINLRHTIGDLLHSRDPSVCKIKDMMRVISDTHFNGNEVPTFVRARAKQTVEVMLHYLYAGNDVRGLPKWLKTTPKTDNERPRKKHKMIFTPVPYGEDRIIYEGDPPSPWLPGFRFLQKPRRGRPPIVCFPRTKEETLLGNAVGT